MTISGTHSTIDNVAGSATADNSGYEVNFLICILIKESNIIKKGPLFRGLFLFKIRNTSKSY